MTLITPQHGEPRSRESKRVAPMIWVFLILVMFSLIAYAGRTQLAATFWHWRHGHSIDLANFVIFVPNHWLPKAIDDARSVVLVNTRPKRSPDTLSAMGLIDVNVEQTPADLEFWAATRRQWLERQGLKDIQVKVIQAQGERILCVGGHELREVVHVPGTLAVSRECKSTMGLSLGYVGDQTGVEEFYGIASRIERRQQEPRR